MAITDEKDVTVKGSLYKERVVPGWDVELGYRLPNNPQLAFFVRGFNWDYKHTPVSYTHLTLPTKRIV